MDGESATMILTPDRLGCVLDQGLSEAHVGDNRELSRRMENSPPPPHSHLWEGRSGATRRRPSPFYCGRARVV